MYEIAGLQTYMYMAEKMGAAGAKTLCASVVVPRKISTDEMRRAANELFRINDGLRGRIVEAADGKVYQETLPYKEQKFEVLNFESREKMDEYGSVYGTLPLRLDVRAEAEPHKVEMPTPSPAAVFHGIIRIMGQKRKAKKLGIGDEVGCCIVKLVQLPDSSGAIIKMHHIASDGWSMMLLANQFLQILKGEQPKAYQFETHLANEEEYRKSKTYQRDLAYFEDQLKEYPDAPLIHKGKMSTNVRAARVITVIDKELSTAIREYAAAHNTSPQALFLAAAGGLVRRELGSDSFYLGSICANRAGIKERNTVGLFVNTPSFHANVHGSDRFADLVEAMRDANYSCFRHQRASFYSSNPFPQAFMVSYQNATLEADRTAICAEYPCSFMPADNAGGNFSIEDRMGEGIFKLNRDNNLQKQSKKQMAEQNRFIVEFIRRGIEDDSRTVEELSS